MAAASGSDCGLIEGFHPTICTRKSTMGNKIVTEADRKRTPRPTPMSGMPLTRTGGGQRSSLERGSHTQSKKNPGKRTHAGGS